MKARYLLAAACGLAVPCFAQVADPWRFPTAAARQEAKCSYWYEDYGAAVALLDKEQAANADAAIAKLRCAIEREKSSGAKMIQGGRRIDYYPYLYLAMAFGARPEPASALAAQQCLRTESAAGMPPKDRQKYDALQTHIAARAAAAEYLTAAQRVAEWEGGKGKVALTAGAAKRLAAIKALADEVVRTRPGAAPPTERLGTELRGLVADEMKARATEMAALEAEPWRRWVAGTADLGACRGGPGEGPPAAALDALERCFQGVGATLRAAGRGECEDLAATRKAVLEEAQALRTWAEWEKSGGARSDEPAALPRACETRWKDEPYATLAPAIERLGAESSTVRGALQDQQRTILAALQQKREALRTCLAAQVAGLPEIPADCTGALGLGTIASRMTQLRQRLSPQRVPDKGLPPKELVPCGQGPSDLTAEIKESVRRGATGLAAIKDCPDIDQGALAGLQQAVERFESDGGIGPLCQAAQIARKAVDVGAPKCVNRLTKSLTDYGTLLTVARRESAPRFAGTAGAEGAPGCVARDLEAVSGLQRGPGARIDVWAKQAIDARQRAQTCLDDLARLTANRFGEVSASFRATREALAPLLADLEKGPAGGVASLPASLRQAIAGFAEVEKRAAGLAAVDPLYRECDRPGTAREALRGAGIDWGAGEHAWDLPSDPSPGFQPDARAACAVLRDAAFARRMSEIDQELARLRQETVRLDPYLVVNGLFSRVAAGDVDGAVRQVRMLSGRRTLAGTGREAALTQMAIAYVFFLKKRQLEIQGADRTILEAVEAEAREAAGLAGKALAAFRPPERLFPGEAFRTWYENTARP